LDIEAEYERLTQALQRSIRAAVSLKEKLSQEDFRTRAPAHVLETVHRRLEEAEHLQEKLLKARDRQKKIGSPESGTVTRDAL